MFKAVLCAALLVPAVAFAKDGNRDTSKPKPTATTEVCTNGQVWDKRSKTCVDVQGRGLDDDVLYQAVREFAYAGQYAHAQSALAAMSDQSEDRVLTYWGFTHRKLGDVEKGMAFYKRALTQNPANITARSYMGQALLLQGDLVGARAELIAIRAHDGRGTWAEQSLTEAIMSGTTYNY